jgi:hypothetical protein
LLQRRCRVGISREFGAKGFRLSSRERILSFKLYSKGRRDIARQRHRVTNWREYDASLRNRGSLIIWFAPAAIAGWKAQPRTTPGGQRHYSDLAIETALTLRAVFRLALRQSEGLIGSIMKMLEIDLPVPDHTTLSRRACGLPVCNPPQIGTGELHLLVDSTGLKLRGAGEWLFEKHGRTKRRAWHKLHIGIDAGNGEIVAFDLTDKDVDDASHVPTLLDQLTQAPACKGREAPRAGKGARGKGAFPRCAGERLRGDSDTVRIKRVDFPKAGEVRSAGGRPCNPNV